VRDQDELRAVRHLADELVVSGDVRLVERRVDLVEHAEGGGLVLEDGKNERDRGERLLAAAHEIDVAELFARRLRDDLDAGFQKVLGVREHELGSASGEELGEKRLEARIDGIERFAEKSL